MKFIIAMAATASALPWEKEVKCGFDAACGFDVVIDEATGCGFDVQGSGWALGGDNGGSKRTSGCTGCAACKANGACSGCSNNCPSGGCENDSGCRNGQCGDSGISTSDWCIGGADCEASGDMVCNGRACDEWCPANAVECILNCLPDDFSPCCSFEAPNFSKAMDMAWGCVKECNKHGPDGDLLGHMKRLGIGKSGCCNCYCNFGCNCNCSGSCSPCGCSGCSGNCEVNEGGDDPHVIGAVNDGDVGRDDVGTVAPTRVQRLRTVGDRYTKVRKAYKPEPVPISYADYFKISEMNLAMGKDTQCGFDNKSQKWVDVKCGFDNNCGFDFECGFDAECGFDVVQNTKCGFDLAREQLGCGFDSKSNTWVNVQCGFDNNCGFDIKA